jgi:hypothetical protein
LAPIPSTPAFERPKRLLPGPIWAKIVGGIGAIFLPVGILFTPVGLTALRQQGASAGTVLLLLGIIFFVVGGGLVALAAREVWRWRRLLAHGIPTWGMAIGAVRDTSTRVNGRNPVGVRYTYYDAHGQAHIGEAFSLDYKRVRALQLDRLQVLYDPNTPSRSLLIDLI